MTSRSNNAKFDLFFTIILVILVLGTPLIFTSYARSVFEVSKLLLLRLSTLTLLGGCLLRACMIRDQLLPAPSLSNARSFWGFRWQKTGLEWPFILWFVTNLISTIFSENVRLSIIGAYDRWEGIVTITNYIILVFLFAKLVHRRWQLHWLLAAFIISTVLSACYGVFQSLGYDFMSWSADPTFRVFACINNPVHYCAYVAMIVPLCLGTLLYIAKRFPSPQASLSIPIRSLPLLKYLSIFVISIALFTFLCFESFSFPLLQACLLLGIGCWVCISNPELVPTRESRLKWAVFGLGVVFIIIFDFISLNKDQWFGFTCAMVSYFLMAASSDRRVLLKRALFLGTLLIFYTQLASFSRATWIGFLLSMPFFYLLITQQFSHPRFRLFVADILSMFLLICSFSLIFIFHLYQHGLAFQLGLTGFIGLSIGAQLWIHQRQLHLKPLFFLLSFLALLLLILLPISSMIRLICLPLLVLLCAQKPDMYRFIYPRLLITVLFLFQQFIGTSPVHVWIYISLILAYYLSAVRGQHHQDFETRFCLFGFLISSGLIMTIPSIISLRVQLISGMTYSLTYIGTGIILTISLVLYAALVTRRVSIPHTWKGILLLTSILVITALPLLALSRPSLIDNKGLRLADNISERTSGYEQQHKRSARISMWKSAVPWFKDYPIFGSGLDTVKYMYPNYRRGEYGILEGGHNFTPDRLHNEYLNTLVTKGLSGTLIYYVGIILGWVLIMLRCVYRQQSEYQSLFIIAFMSGAGIYLGQVLFNFGVVATLVLFYMFLGLGLALANQPELFRDAAISEGPEHE